MKTEFILLMQYDGMMIIPVQLVCRDFFSHLTPEKFLRKVSLGEIKIPVVRIEHSQKTAKGVDIRDLARYIDVRREAAIKEMNQLTAFDQK